MKNQDTLKIRHAIYYDNLETEKKYLEEMAQKGWMIKELNGIQHVFEKTAPVKLTFAVELFSEGSVYDTHPAGNGAEYIDFCEKAGWHFICSNGKIHLFYSEKEELPPIETDQEMKLKTIRKTMRFNNVFWPVYMMIVSVVIVGYHLTLGLNQLESSVLSFSAVLLWFCIFFVGIYQLSSYIIWVSRAKKAVLQGMQLPQRKHLSWRGAMTVLLLAGVLHSGIVVWLGEINRSKEALVVPLIWGVVFAITVCTVLTTEWASKRKIERTSNMLLTLVILPVCICGVLLGGITAGVIYFMGHMEKESAAIEIPEEELNVFCGSDRDGKYCADGNDIGSFLLDIKSYMITAEDESPDSCEWSFERYTTKVPAIHNRILREAFGHHIPRTFSITYDFSEAVRSELLSTDSFSVYESADEETRSYFYLIYDEDTVLTLASFGESLSEEQMDIIYRYILHPQEL